MDLPQAPGNGVTGEVNSVWRLATAVAQKAHTTLTGLPRMDIVPGPRYGHVVISLAIVFTLRIVKGSWSAFSSGTVEKSDVPRFLRRHQ